MASRIEKMTINQLWDHISVYPEDSDARLILLQKLGAEHTQELKLVRAKLLDRSMDIRTAFGMMLDFELEVAEVAGDPSFPAADKIFSIDEREKPNGDNGGDTTV